MFKTFSTILTDKWQQIIDIFIERSLDLENHSDLSIMDETTAILIRAMKLIKENRYNHDEFYEDQIIAELITLPIIKAHSPEIGQEWNFYDQNYSCYAKNGSKLESPVTLLEEPKLNPEQLWQLIFKKLEV